MSDTAKPNVHSSSAENSSPIPVRIPNEIRDRVDALAARIATATGLEPQKRGTMLLALIRSGLEGFERRFPAPEAAPPPAEPPPPPAPAPKAPEAPPPPAAPPPTAPAEEPHDAPPAAPKAPEAALAPTAIAFALPPRASAEEPQPAPPPPAEPDPGLRRAVPCQGAGMLIKIETRSKKIACLVCGEKFSHDKRRGEGVKIPPHRRIVPAEGAAQ